MVNLELTIALINISETKSPPLRQLLMDNSFISRRKYIISLALFTSNWWRRKRYLISSTWPLLLRRQLSAVGLKPHEESSHWLDHRGMPVLLWQDALSTSAPFRASDSCSSPLKLSRFRRMHARNGRSGHYVRPDMRKKLTVPFRWCTGYVYLATGCVESKS